MCGLAGIFQHSAEAEVDRPLLYRMTSALRHRGPDGEGFHFEPGLGLGHRRLAVIDVQGGHQPMYNEDDTVVIVFNGEIYNFQELRRQLEAEGHRFRNHCDTETIIHAWESWGPECLEHLSGMFAFALWDRNRQCLFLARDRLGKKPLHYAIGRDGTLVFASELAGLVEFPGLQQNIDPVAVDAYFTFGYIPDPYSIYRDIRKLPPASYLVVQRGGRGLVPQRYWCMHGAPSRLDTKEASRELIGHMTRTVQARLIADVPLGAFLSGGIDSSAVVAIAAGLRTSPLATFTIGFTGAEDERPFAALVARRYGTAHHNDAAAVDYIDAAGEQARIFGEPFGDSSSVPTLAICASARRHVTVALSGDGGDEVLAGYRRYYWHRLTEAVRRFVPPGLRRQVIGRLARAYPKLDRAPRWLRAKHTLTEISLDSALGYFRTVCKVQHDRRRGLFSEEMLSRLDGYDPGEPLIALMEESGTDDPVCQAQYVDLNTYLPGDILTKIDRASMANGLEVRSPLLDHDFVEWGLGLPSRLKLRGGQGKYLLKLAMRPLLPEQLLWRRKQGFTTALGVRLRAEAARMRTRLLGPAMLDSGIFRPEILARLVDEHESSQFDHSGVLWLLLVFEGFLALLGDPAAAINPGGPAVGDAARSVASPLAIPRA